jgi:hypothetical protein
MSVNIDNLGPSTKKAISPVIKVFYGLVTESFRRELFSHIGTDAETGLADGQMKKLYQKLFNILVSFLGPVTKSYNALY